MRKKRKIRMVHFEEETQEFVNCRTTRGFPMGGIGTGGFSMLTDGGFGEFITQHNWYKAIKDPKGTFFAIWTKKGDEKIAKILRRGYRGGKEYLNIKNVEHTRFNGKIPQFFLSYQDEKLPVDVQLNGFTPLIPQNPKDSSLPVSIFSFTIKNKTEEEIESSLMGSFQNILGLGGTGCTRFFLRNGSMRYNSTKGNFSEDFNTSLSEGIAFKTKQNYKPKNPRRRVIGEYGLSYVKDKFNDRNIISITRALDWEAQQDECAIWSEFEDIGELKEEIEPRKGQKASSLAVKFKLPAREEIKIEFVISWWIPYHLIEKSPRIRRIFHFHNGIDHGHYFLNHFKNLAELINYTIREKSRLYDESTQLQNILEGSNLPRWLTTLILNLTDSILTNSVLTKKGEYYAMEGMPWAWMFGGLTGTNDQRLSSHPYTSVFFPSLDKTELESFRLLAENGKVPHGNGNVDLALGDADVPYGKPIKALNKTTDWIDLTMSEICQIGKLILITGDTDYLVDIWDDLIQMMAYLNSNLVDGVPEGGSTYDIIPYHPCFLYNVVLYLASIRMMIDLAELMKELKPEKDDQLDSLIKSYSELYIVAEKQCFKRLWKKRGYYMVCQSRDTLFQGGLAGDWIARYSGLDPVIQYNRARTHNAWQSKALVDSHDSMPDGNLPGLPLTYSEATPDGEEIMMKVMYLNIPAKNYFWQVLSYQAMEGIYVNRIEPSLEIFRRLYDKLYKQGYPWDANLYALPGFVYMTHPVVWAVFNAFTGAALDVPRKKLTLSPRILPGTDFIRIPFFFPKFWAILHYNKKTKEAMIDIYKSFDESFEIEIIVNRTLKGESKKIKLEEPFKIINGALLNLKLEI